MEAYVKARKKQISGSLNGWTCETKVLQFVDVDTRKEMED